ncbi:hypothetical protein KFL_001950100 [Klebsormidium nitens]|uniref:S-adenosyl-L-methionine-dependent methyltransferases superfamily protein n=1 Tax=Klebsormidium nitens TaxID=105231 RepID=A0A1Y1I780_KLENI|nr:hypothetical protein KFL_001950100 [Klebsormidium nitens]|eukprot:GAQ84577.1 hypothetical protein KFL_001950100 [Klebsormidium nitens]
MPATLWSWASRKRVSEDQLPSYSAPAPANLGGLDLETSPSAWHTPSQSDSTPGFWAAARGGYERHYSAPPQSSLPTNGGDEPPLYGSPWTGSGPSSFQIEGGSYEPSPAPWRRFPAKEGASFEPTETPWKVSAYPSYQQVPSMSQESSQQTVSSRGVSDTAERDPSTREGSFWGGGVRGAGGPRLEASAVFSLKAAATNRYLSKLASQGGSQEEREVSSSRNQQDQVAPVLSTHPAGRDTSPRLRTRGQPAPKHEEWEIPTRGEPFLGATRIRLERHLSSGHSPNSQNSQGLGSIGNWALQHASGASDRQQVMSLCAINPDFFPEERASQQSLRLDAQVPDMDADAVRGGASSGSGDPLEETSSPRGVGAGSIGTWEQQGQRTEPGNPWGRDLSLRGGFSGRLRTGVSLPSRGRESLYGGSAPDESWLRDISPRAGSLDSPGGGGLLSPGGHRKRHSFDVEEAGDDRALKFMRRSMELERDATGVPADATKFPGDFRESVELREMHRIWGQQPESSQASRSYYPSALTAVEEGSTGVALLDGPSAGLHRNPFDRSLSVHCSPQQTRKLTPRARSASPRLRQAVPVSMLTVHRAELSPSRVFTEDPPNSAPKTQQVWDDPSGYNPPSPWPGETFTPPSRSQPTASSPRSETPSSPFGAFPRAHPLSPVETYVVRTGREVAYVSTRYPSYRSPGGGSLGQQSDQGVSPMDIGPAAEPLGSNRQSEGQRAAATWTYPGDDSCAPQDGDSCKVQEGASHAPAGDETCTPLDVSEPPRTDGHAATARPEQLPSGDGGVFTPVASHQAAFVTEEPSANSLVSQVSLSHWANLTLDLACLKEAASPVPEEAESPELGDISPLELPPQKTWESPTTTPAFSAGSGASFRDEIDTRAQGVGQGPANVPGGVKKSGSRDDLGLPSRGSREFDTEVGKAGGDPAAPFGDVKKSGSRENLGLPRRGSREFREQQAAELALVAADVTTWLDVLRGGLKRQARERGWTPEERAAAKHLASAAVLGETIVQRIKQEGGVNLMIKLLDSDDEEMMESAADVISHCNGAFQSKPMVKVFDFSDGTSVSVRETQFSDTGLGCKVWKAAVLLGDQLSADPSLVAGKSVLEIGSGCGLCGFLATKLGAQDVTLTDNTIPLLVNLRDSVRTLLCEPAPSDRGGELAPSKDPPAKQSDAPWTTNATINSQRDFQKVVSSDSLHRLADASETDNRPTSFAARTANDAANKLTAFGGLVRPTGLPPLGTLGPSSGLGLRSMDSGDGYLGLGVNEAVNLIEGPDPIRRAHLIQNRPQSPTAAFNGLSFRSPPLGPQPFLSLKASPTKTQQFLPPVSKPGRFESSWDSWYTIPGGWSDDSAVSGGVEVGEHGDDVNTSLAGGVNGDSPGGVNGGASLVRVRQLEWDDDAAALGTGQVQLAEAQAGTSPPKLAADEVFDIIVGSDCLYSAAAIESLSAVIKRRMAQPHGQCLLVSAVRDLGMFEEFRKRLVERGLDVRVSKIDEDAASPALEDGGTFHDAGYYPGGFISMHISHGIGGAGSRP